MPIKVDFPQVILVRTQSSSSTIISQAEQLTRMSGIPALLLVDMRQTNVSEVNLDVLPMTRDEDVRLGLYAPKDVGWRCGDYGFYAARARFPKLSYYWMIEDDVRIGGDGAEFFAHVAHFPEIDFLASYIRPAEPDWWWYGHAMSRDATTWRSFFPVTRLSGRAIDRLWATRRRHSQQWHRRALWPNDEAFVATTVAGAGLSYADLNGLGTTFYDEDTFGYTHALDPAQVPGIGSPQLFHPVLDEAARVRRDARLRQAETRLPLNRRGADRLLKLVNGATRW